MSELPSSDVVLIVAPVGADARNISDVLQKAHHAPKVCRTAADMAAGLHVDCGAIILTEEALTPELMGTLAEMFRDQPPWSDIPVILISSTGPESMGPIVASRLRGPRRTITLLERPLRSATLLATLDSLLAARHRQYEIRDLLHERDVLLSSLESRVAERTSELRRMVEEMEAFSYSVSHDLRSPLRSLAGYANVLQEDHGNELSPTARSYLEKIARAAQRMDRLTQDVLAYTRATQCEMVVEPVDLDDLFVDVIEQYPAVASPANRIIIHRPLGRVRGHVPSLIQCFSNLLGNAVKFVAQGTTPEIRIRSDCDGQWRRVFIRDNGIGIDPVHHERIFRMFERAAGKQVAGTGIGLAIVKKAIERMGGAVGVSSAPGSGAEFWIQLRACNASSIDGSREEVVPALAGNPILVAS
jgi:signal transduction histidine kinase